MSKSYHQRICVILHTTMKREVKILTKSAISAVLRSSLLCAGQFQNEFSDLQNLTSYKIQSVEEGSDGTNTVRVDAECSGKNIGLKFILARKDTGRKKGAFMTRQLLKVTQ